MIWETASSPPSCAIEFLVEGNPKKNKREAIHDAVMDKNFYWLSDYKIPNGVHVYGRRYNPHGPKNYPFRIAED